MTYTTHKTELQGVIAVGDTYVWEPFLPWACVTVVVTELGCHNGSDRWIQTMTASGSRYGNRHWNEESRIREACVPALSPSEVERINRDLGQRRG